MLRPRALMEAFGREQPGAWAALERLRQQRAQEWPPHVFAPLDIAGLAIVQSRTDRGLPRPRDAWVIIEPATRLAGLAPWRLTQQVYRFDPDLFAALVETPITGNLPGQVLRYLPAWSVYVETPGLSVPTTDGSQEPLHGVFAWLDWRRDRGEDILTLGLDTDLQLAIGHVPLVGTLDAGLAQVEADWREGLRHGTALGGIPQGYAEAAKGTFGPLLSVLLYLCADQADYERPAWPTPRPVKGGARWFPVDKPSVWMVGERVGAALRAARNAEPADPQEAPVSTRARPRGHIRRAHWHSFLKGPRDGERTVFVKWLPPLGVNLELGEGEGLPTVVVPVR